MQSVSTWVFFSAHWSLRSNSKFWIKSGEAGHENTLKVRTENEKKSMITFAKKWQNPGSYPFEFKKKKKPN